MPTLETEQRIAYLTEKRDALLDALANANPSASVVSSKSIEGTSISYDRSYALQLLSVLENEINSLYRKSGIFKRVKFVK